MKPLKETFVIVELYASGEDYFKDHVSFDKAELEIKCAEMNKEKNDGWEKEHNDKKRKHQFTPSVVFMVYPLKEAIEQFARELADYYTPEDESI